jgi:hypothetical protein
VYVAADDDIWIAGGPGGIAHFDGHAWTQISVHSNADLYLVPHAPDDVWALTGIGPGTPGAFHFDGQKWVSVPAPMAGQPITSLGAAAPDDAWATVSTSLFHWDGKAWTPSSMTLPGDYADLVGSGPDNLWITGDKTLLRHSNGAWQPVTPPPPTMTATSYTLLPFQANDAWAIESGPAVYRWDGSSWTSGVAPPQSGSFFGRASNDVWVPNSYGVEHWNGTAWSSVLVPGMGSVAAVDGSTSVWGVGTLGSIAQFVGTQFVAKNTPVASSATNSFVHAFADDDVVVVGDRTLSHWDGTAFTPAADVGMNVWYAADGPSSQDYFVVGATLVPDMTGGLSPTYGTAAHVVGGKETILPMPSATMPIVHALYVAADNAAWAVGDQGTIVHYDGKAWSFVSGWSPSPTNGPFRSVFGRSATDIWAAGSNLTVHFDGNAWTAVDDPVAKLVDHVCPGVGNEIWGSSYNGVVHYDGSTWQLLPWPADWPPTGDNTTLSQCATSGKHAYFTSTQGFVVHWDGATLSQELLYRGGIVNWIQAAGASPAGTLWLALAGGQLVYRQP